MTGVPLLESKLHPPRRRPGTVRRSRLDKRLIGRPLPELVLVSAGAGFGKTTLVTEWLAADRAIAVRTAWLSLDHRDSDPSVFWTYVVSALRKVEPTIGTDALATLEAAPGALETVVAMLLNDLAALEDDVVLVLDDYHLLESLEVHESMRFLLEHLPSQLHLVVASRADPPWPLAGLRARGALLEIRAADLRFTGEEAATYLNDAMGLSLSAEEVDALDGRTEGWAAALQLAALSLQGRDDVDAFITNFAGDDRFIVDYLVDEVLERQSEDVRAFLLETSILNRLSAPLCAAVTGRDDAREALASIERSNLFLVALDDQRRWYRYHHLFADVLRARLADEHLDLTVLHRRAGEWFAANGDTPEAIRHAMAAGDHAQAADLIELSIPALRQSRQEATLRQWLEALPPEVFPTRPVLTIGLAGSRMGTGDASGVEALLDDAERWLQPGSATDDMVVHDEAELRRLPAQVALYRAGLALLRGELPATIEHGERAYAQSAQDDHLGRGAAGALIGLAHWATGDLDSATRQYTATIAEFHQAEHYADILGCSLGLADMQMAQGRLTAAEQTLRSALEIATLHGPLRGTPDMHAGLAEIHLERNEIEAAAARLRASLELGEHLALPQHDYRWRVVEARLCAAAGDHAAALELLAEAAERYNTDFSPPVRPVTAIAARVHLARGDLDAAAKWATDAGVTADDEPVYVREYEHLTFARLLLATGRVTEAVPFLSRLLAAAKVGGRERSVVEAHLLLARAHQASGDRAHTLESMEAAILGAEPERYIRLFVAEGDAVARLLRLTVEAGLATEPASALLSSITAQPPPQPARALVDELTVREVEVLRLLRSDLTGPEIAAQLFVSLNTVRTHTKNIFMKLDVTNRRAAVRRADELGL